jgi:hypothetical protein
VLFLLLDVTSIIECDQVRFESGDRICEPSFKRTIDEAVDGLIVARSRFWDRRGQVDRGQSEHSVNRGALNRIAHIEFTISTKLIHDSEVIGIMK